MGTDPATSLVDPHGQLHHVARSSIGDTSAFPTAVGPNPILTCMALARRTAHEIFAATPAASSARAGTSAAAAGAAFVGGSDRTTAASSGTA